MKLFKKNYFYIKLYFNKIEITNLLNEETIAKSAVKKFSTNRIVIADFNALELLIRETINDLLKNSKVLFTQNSMLIHHLEKLDGGITEIEKRAMRDLCEQAGATNVFIITDNNRISNYLALVGIKNKTFEN
jgi:MreB/Mbl protein